jgi:trimeric autotransporter adhesin
MRIPVAVVFWATVLNAAQLSLPYSVSVVAGGTNVGDGGLATSGSLLDAEGIAIDGVGNIYIADAGDNRVRMIAPSGIISTLAGTTSASTLKSPYGLAADGLGNVYVADLGNNRIQKIASNGAAITLLSQLNMPRNVLADNAGNLYFSEFGGHRVRRIGPDGSVTLIAGTGTSGFGGDGGNATAAQLSFPAGLALDTYGNLYIADSGNNRIRKISGGRISTVLGAPSTSLATAGELATPTAVAVDAAGDLYVADSGNQRIRKLTAAGTITTIPLAARDLALDSGGNLIVADVAHVYRVLGSGAVTTIAGDGGYLFRGDGGPATMARLNSPSGVALDGNGNVWIADTANARIRMVTAASGQISTVAGGNGQLNSPVEIGFDPGGDLLIADPAGYRIRELTASSASVVTLAGDGVPGSGGDGFPATSTPLRAPGGVAEGATGPILISDTGNHRVQRMFGGVLVTVAGNGAAGFNGDGPGQGVELNSPAGLSVDGAGNLYIADAGNNRIRVLTPDGNVKTIAGPNQLNNPRGVAVDAAGNLWIADTGNHRVVVLPPGGVLTEVAAQLQSPWSLAIDPGSGSVYVADSGSNLVLMLSPGPPALTELPTPVTVVNAATLQAGPVAAGSLISIFGAGLGGAQVLFDGQAAALILSQNTQINTRVPLNASGAMEVVTGSTVLLNTTLTIAPSAPGIFTGPGGTGPVIMSNQDGTVNSNTYPAAQGSIVAFYATGIGQSTVGVSIGGAAAGVLFAGDAPGFVGVSQINVQVPAGIASGTVPLLLTAGSAQSQGGVTMFVQ